MIIHIQKKTFAVAIGLLFLFAAGYSAASPIARTQEQDENKKLLLLNREIAVFRSENPNITPTERARDAAQRMSEARDEMEEPGVTTSKITVGEEAAVRFNAGKDTYLFTLLQSDLNELAGETLEVTSKKALKQIELALEAKDQQQEPGAILKGVSITAIATLILVVGWLLIRRISRWLSKKSEVWIRKIDRLNIHQADLRPHLVLLLRKVIGLLHACGVLVLVYLWLTTSLYQFPITAPWGAALGDHLREISWHIGNAIMEALPGLGIVAAIFLVARWLSRLANHLIQNLGISNNEEGVMSPDTSRATRRIVIAIIWLFAVVMSYPYIPGSGSVAFQGVSMLLGLMISLGSSGMINQVMSGFVMLYSGSLRTGEYARVGDIEGTITEMGMLSTRFLTPKKEFISVPNAVIVSNPTYNYSRLVDRHGAVVTASVTIGYDTPWRQVHALLLLAADRTDGVRKTPKPRILQKGLLDHYVDYSLIFYIDKPCSRPAVLSALHAEIQDAFNEYNVQIMSPHFIAQPEQELVIPKAGWFSKPAEPIPVKKTNCRSED